MRYLFFLFIFIASMPGAVLGQDSIVGYFDRYDRVAYIRDSAVYYRVGKKDKNGEWVGEVREYYKSGKFAKAFKFEKGKKNGAYLSYYENGNKMETGLYVNDKKNLVWQTYYENGKLKSEGNYKAGEEDGPWKNYHNNGNVSSEGIYQEGDPAGRWKNYFSNGLVSRDYKYETKNNKTKIYLLNVNDSLGNKMVVDGKGYAKDFDEWTDCYEEGPYENGVRTGEWKGKHAKNLFTFVEYYQADTLVKGESTDSVGNKYQYNIADLKPEFGGGQGEMMKFLVKNIRYPEMEANETIQGRVYVGFYISLDGSVKNVSVKRWVSPGLDKEALRVVEKMPKWKPGLVRGVPMERKYILPINFKIN